MPETEKEETSNIMQRATVSLDDKYASTEGRVHITGSQALVRLGL